MAENGGKDNPINKMWSTPDTSFGSVVKPNVDFSKGDSSKAGPKLLQVDTLERVARATEETARRTAGEQVDVLPQDPKKQREFVMGLTEQIEANDLPVGPVPGIYPSPINATLAARISSLSESLRPEIKKEAIARLRLQHCAAIADAVPGDTDAAKQYLYNVFLQPESRRYALEGEDFDFLLNHGIPNLKITEAFMLLQRASTSGIKIDGETLRLTDEKLSLTKRDAILKKIEEELGGDKYARKSLQLARRIASATLETSVWNTDLLGNDPIAEAIYFRIYRIERARKARDRGPDITIPRIEGFGTSFLRSVQTAREIDLPESRGTKNAYLFLPQPAKHPSLITYSETPQERIEGILQRNRKEPLNPKGLEFPLIRPGEYVGWLGITVPRILVFKELLLKSTWKPEEFSSDAVESMVAPANAADSEQALRLRSEFILGAFWSVFSRPREAMNHGWDKYSLRAVEDNLLRVFRTEEGTDASFLTKAQLRWTKDVLKKYYKLNVDHAAAMVGVRIRFSKRVIQS